jgi:hypothetical protein
LLSDPQSVTYDGNAKSLPRTSIGPRGTEYTSSDGVFQVKIWRTPNKGDFYKVDITLTRRSTNPDAEQAFEGDRIVENSVKLGFVVDTTRHEASTVIPLLRTALLNYVDSTLQGRLLAGEA